ncbi:MAG: hypothetical protein KKC79_12575 [Gammaproteobacteria bacterium]|nr:hypothetical protein [Gammaproteobacteria bacterium]MBU1441945.1 hypothetical protein [Gammaproteobacteria bacterium]MBU2284980.1 hypothetical protein [Gammaproteobacteria bacterium]MBU2409467.1 hypothetical protein [Gammaproteobacteria bacterium]
MEFMLIFKEPTESFGIRKDPGASPAYWAAWNAYLTAISQSGVVLDGRGLMPPETSTTVRVRNGKRQVQDGPFADTHEHLGGYFVINVDSLDAALEWAARAPCAEVGSTEVRPVMAKQTASKQ